MLLELDLGDERRRIVSGIAKRYTPESLTGKQIVIVANLAPREIFGIESAGMLLAAGSDDGPVLLQPDTPIEYGASVR